MSGSVLSQFQQWNEQAGLMGSRFWFVDMEFNKNDLELIYSFNIITQPNKHNTHHIIEQFTLLFQTKVSIYTWSFTSVQTAFEFS